MNLNFTDATDSFGSFSDLLRAKNLLPSHLLAEGKPATAELSPLATTIVALVHDNARAVTMVADRRASSGSHIVKDDMQKLFIADRLSAIGIAGAAGIGIELARVFAMELEHIEKIESRPLSLPGKIRRLSLLLSSNLSFAMHSLAAIPIFAGFDVEDAQAKLFTFDLLGGVYDQSSFAAIGSGAVLAQASMLNLDPRVLLESNQSEATTILLKALHAASLKDAATSGIQGVHLPLVVSINEHGASFVPEDEISALIQQIR